MIQAIPEAYALEHGPGAHLTLFARHTGVIHRQCHILERGRMPDQMESLEHKSDVVQTHPSFLLAR